MRAVIIPSLFIVVGSLSCRSSESSNVVKTAILVQDLPEDFDPELISVLTKFSNAEIVTLKNGHTQIWQVDSAESTEVMAAIRTIHTNANPTVSKVPGDYTALFWPRSPTLDLTQGQNDILAAIKRSKMTAGVRVVKLPPQPLVEHALTEGFPGTAGGFRIPVAGATPVVARRTHVERTGKGLTWEGTLREPDDTLLIMFDGKVLTGTVHEGNKVYSIRPIGSGLYAIIEKKLVGEEHPPRFKTRQDDANKRDRRDAPPPPRRNQNKPVQVDVVVAYTKNAAQSYEDINRDLIKVAELETNQSIRASKVNDVTIRIVHAYETAYKERDSWNDHLDLFVGKNDKAMDEIHRKRHEHKGDIAVLIVDDATHCGEARAIYADPGTAFAVVHHNCATGYYSFAHEIGHLFGARHDRDADPNDNPFPHGHGFRNKKWRTIMAYGRNPRRKIWSTPSVRVGGETAGSERHEHNAKVLREVAGRIANFK